MADYMKKAAKSAAEYNRHFLRERREERVAYFDLQTFVSITFETVGHVSMMLLYEPIVHKAMWPCVKPPFFVVVVETPLFFHIW